MLDSEIHLCKREPSTAVQLWLDPITIRESKSIVQYLYMYSLVETDLTLSVPASNVCFIRCVVMN